MTNYAARRTMMVDTQVRPSDVTKFPIIDAMLSVPREAYVPDAMREAAYAGENMDLGGGRVILDPRTLAKMLDALEIGPDDLVLDVASALGYSSAVLAHMAAAVIAVEENAEMAADAQAQWTALGADNVIMHQGPLAQGAAEHGPYDVIVVQGGVGEMPSTLTDQLKEGGRMACLFMEGALGVVRIGHKVNDRMNWRYAFNASAPVIPAFEKQPEFAL
jgi:protein-L-isoaspartate(D-aspartate) O-methyltransferase